MRVLFVTPRWGPDIAGGAERAARAWGIALAQRGHEVRALTTTATTLDWTPVFDAGEHLDDGVTVVRRHATPRDGDVNRALRAIGPLAAHLETAHARRLIERQGPIIDGIEDAARDADVVVAYPYLYWTSLHATEVAGRRTVVHPAAHPEPLVALSALAPVFTAPGGLVYQTVSERRTVEAHWPSAQVRSLQLAPPLAATRHQRAPWDQRTIVLAVGRYEHDKGSDALRAVAEALPEPLRVVVAGPVVEPPRRPSRVETLGVVSDARLGQLRTEAIATVILSRYESYSLAGAESLAAGVPIIVNSTNDVLVELATTSGAGIIAADGLDVAAAIVALANDHELAARLEAAALTWAQRRPGIHEAVERYEAFLTEVATHAPTRRGR